MSTRIAAVAAGLAFPALAAAAPPIDPNATSFTTGGLAPFNPLEDGAGGIVEVAGPLSTVNVSAPAGTFTAADNVQFDVVVFGLDSMGAVLRVGVQANVLTQAAAGDGSIIAALDFSTAANIATLINSAQVFESNGTIDKVRIGIVANDATADGADGAETLLDATSETNDTTLDADDAPPTIAQVLLDSTMGMERLIIVFDGSINDGTLGTTVANLVAADFEFSTDGGMTFGAIAGVNVPPTLIGTSQGRAIQFTISNTTLAPAIGNLVRLALPDNGGTTNNEVVDISLNVANSQTAVSVAAVQAPSIASASWVATIAAGAAGPGALRVDLNQQAGSTGDTTFWQNQVMGTPSSITQTSDCGGVPCLTVTGVQPLNPNFPNSIFLDVTSAATDSVQADGLNGPTTNLNPTPFSLSVNSASGGTAPTDFLGTSLSGSSTTTITDAIPPTDSGAPRTLDLNNDGIIDAFGLPMSEPIASGATAGGFTFTKLNGVTVNPIGLLLANIPGNTDLTDTANQATVVADGMNDTFPPTTFSLQSGDATDRLQTNNILVAQFDGPNTDWDDDGMTGASDTDGEAHPGTGNLLFASFAMTSAGSGVTDVAGNAFDADLGTGGVQDFPATAVSVDGANPLAVEAQFVTADNIDNTGVQIGVETDGNAAVTAKPVPGTVGDQATNNQARFITSEIVGNAGVDPTKFIHGNQPTERFQAGDFVSVMNNSFRLQDNTASGYEPGDSLTIANGNMIGDATNNELRPLNNNALTVVNRSAPYVSLQTDINNNNILSAFVNDTNNDGFADQVRLLFTANIDAATVDAADFTFQNTALSVVGNPSVSGSIVTINFTDGVEVFTSSLEVVVNIVGNSGIADTAGNALENTAPTPVVCQPVPEPTRDGEFMGVMDISGAITGLNGSVVPAGTQVFGMFIVPVAKSISISVDGLSFRITDTSSLEAVTNVILGIETEAFLIAEDPIEEGNDMVIRNDKDDLGSGARIKGRIIVNVRSLDNVQLNIQGGSRGNGSVLMSWDVGRSSSGTAKSFFDNGQDFGDEAIVSAAVVTGDTGEYLLHMTAPTGGFNGFVSAVGRPVIMVVVLPTGERFPVTGLLNKIGGGGPILFTPMNRSDSPAATTFNIDLRNIARRDLFMGWNGLADDRNAGFATQSNARPVLPAGVASANVRLGTNLPNATALSRYVYHHESASPSNQWTAADDFGDLFDSLVIDVNCLDFVAFTATSRGVAVASDTSRSGISAVVGGYATGFFSMSRLGVFQFGAAIPTQTSLFTLSDPFPNNNSTLGWGFFTNTTGAQSNPTTFLSANGLDFAIFFTQDANGIQITTLGPGGTGDTTDVPAAAAFFGHTP